MTFARELRSFGGVYYTALAPGAPGVLDIGGITKFCENRCIRGLEQQSDDLSEVYKEEKLFKVVFRLA